MKEDKDDQFYCEITYYVPGGLGMIETNRINITVYCEFHMWYKYHRTAAGDLAITTTGQAATET